MDAHSLSHTHECVHSLSHTPPVAASRSQSQPASQHPKQTSSEGKGNIRACHNYILYARGGDTGSRRCPLRRRRGEAGPEPCEKRQFRRHNCDSPKWGSYQEPCSEENPRRATRSTGTGPPKSCSVKTKEKEELSI